MIVADLMTTNPITVPPSATLGAAQEAMQVGRFRQVPVVDNGRLIGVLTDRDVRQHLGQLNHVRVDAVMSTHPFSVQPSTPVEQAAHILVTNKVGSLPVVDDGKLVGIIAASDLLQVLEAILGKTGDGSVRIDLNVAGSGEITAAISLIRTICPALAIGTYSRNAEEGEVLYLRVAATGAQRAAQKLRDYGFKVIAVHAESVLSLADRGNKQCG
jgi:acetoin utilization protein AcuB